MGVYLLQVTGDLLPEQRTSSPELLPGWALPNTDSQCLNDEHESPTYPTHLVCPRSGLSWHVATEATDSISRATSNKQPFAGPSEDVCAIPSTCDCSKCLRSSSCISVSTKGMLDVSAQVPGCAGSSFGFSDGLRCKQSHLALHSLAPVVRHPQIS